MSNQRILQHLRRCYPESSVESIAEEIENLIRKYQEKIMARKGPRWTQNDVAVITYGNSVIRKNERPLETLYGFSDRYLANIASILHILPHFPFSSDDGFSVKDYYNINPELGDWKDIEKLSSGSLNLMVDIVINHVSSQSKWFQNFLRQEGEGKDYFIEVEPCDDLKKVVRPRSSDLCVPVTKKDKKTFIWATFSEDQIDLNFKNPEVLLRIIDIFFFYMSKGYTFFRLDAVAFLWKETGTSCVHLPQTHEIVKLLRTLSQIMDPNRVLITETNVPNRENLSYFGNRNEAHMVYNFSLPPLVLHALWKGTAAHLKTWMMSMPPAPTGCAYLNFLASHDGIGLRPLEGLAPENEIRDMLELVKTFGGEISYRRKESGEDTAYEMNISYYDALRGTFDGQDEFQFERFICAQIIMMSIEGIPAFYIHSLLATANDFDKVKKTGMKRSINRSELDFDEMVKILADENHPRAKVFYELSRLIKIRKKQGAFHPNATQYTLHLSPSVFGFWRQSRNRDQSIFSIHNLKSGPQNLNLADLNLVGTDQWKDLISGAVLKDFYGIFTLQPYQSLWLTNKF